MATGKAGKEIKSLVLQMVIKGWLTGTNKDGPGSNSSLLDVPLLDSKGNT